MKIFGRAAPVLGLLGIGLIAAPLAAAPRSIRDCEKIQAADAYNQCLASFGPVAHLRGMKSAPDSGDDTEDGGDSDAPPPPHSSNHRSHGRQHMIIDVGDGSHAHHRHWYHHRHRH